ncbi:nucleoplasmin-like protein NO29 [Arapaima gigas]
MMKDPLKSLVPLPGPLVPTAGQHHPAVEKLKLTPEEQRRHNLPYIQVSLGEFELKAPVTLRLKSGSGPVTVSGFHLTAYESSEEEEEDEEEEIIPVKPAKKKQKL